VADTGWPDDALATQYDAIATQYRRSRQSPLRRYVERYSLFELVGDVAGRSVLDLACGEGTYSRELKLRGATRVVGVDISSAMIELAEQQEQADPLGVDYVCADVRQLPDLGCFDIVVAAYLLHYAPTESDLAAMCDGIRRHLAPGGRFVALNENPVQPPGRYSGYEQYGFGKAVELPRREGSPISYWMIAGKELFRFVVYHHDRAIYEKVLGAAGFEGISWSRMQVDPRGVAACGDAYWQEYLDNPPVCGLVCSACG